MRGAFHHLEMAGKKWVFGEKICRHIAHGNKQICIIDAENGERQSHEDRERKREKQNCFFPLSECSSLLSLCYLESTEADKKRS